MIQSDLLRGTMTTAMPGAAAWLAPKRASAFLLLATLTLLHLLAAHQGIHWASPLLIGDHLFGLLAAVTIIWYALALGRRVAGSFLGLSDDPLAENLAALAMGSGLLSTGILVAGFFRLYYGALFLAAGVALTLWLRRDLGAILHVAGVAITRWSRAGMPTAPTRGQRMVLLILILSLVTVVIRATDPVSGFLVDWDALAYHLAAPRIYVQLHQIVPLPDMSLANAPSSEEMLFIPGLMAGIDTLGNALTVCFAILLSLAAYTVARRHFDQRSAWLSVLLLFSTFWIVIIMPLTLTDFTAAFPIVLGFGDLMAWLDRRAADPPPATCLSSMPPWTALHGQHRLLIRAGLLLGLGISCKLTSLPALPAVVCTTGLTCLLIKAPTVRLRLVWALWAATIVGLAALVALSPWLLKNWYFFGRPLYPATVAVSTPMHDGIATSTAANPGHLAHLQWLAGTLLQFFWNFAGHASLLLLAAPFVLRRTSARAALLFLLLGGVLWLTFVPAWTPRYYLALVVIADVLIAATLITCTDRLRLPPLVVEAALTTYLLLSSIWVLGTGAGLMLRDQALSAALGSISPYNYLSARLRPYQAEQYMNTMIPKDAVVAMVGVTRGFYLERPYLGEWYGERLARLEQNPSSRRTELAVWCRAGVRYAIFDRGDDQFDDIAQAGIRPAPSFAWLRQPGLAPRTLFSAQGVDVLAVQPCAARQQ